MISRSIIAVSLLMGYLSILYFFSLVFSAPILVTSLFFIAIVFLLFNKFRKEVDRNIRKERNSAAVFGVVILGLLFIIQSAIQEAQKYGAWDAWWFWNYHAKFLAHPEIWKEAYSISSPKLLTSRVAHADYPLMLPATVGFFWRLFSSESNSIPFLLSFVYTAFVPLLIFFETFKKNLLIASIVFFGFVANKALVNIGVNQLADIFIAFFFLAAFVALTRFKEDRKDIDLFLCGAALGSCIWLKNEGALLATAFIIFNIKILFRVKNWRQFCFGLLPFIFAFFVFKIFYAPAGDLSVAITKEVWVKLTSWERLQIIFEGIKKSLHADYPWVKVFAAACLIIGLARRQYSFTNIGVIILCLLGFIFVYLISPHDLGWHVNTSISRLLLQLLPAFIYILLMPLLGHMKENRPV